MDTGESFRKNIINDKPRSTVKQDSFAAIMYVNALNNFFLSFMVPTVVELGVEGKI